MILYKPEPEPEAIRRPITLKAQAEEAARKSLDLIVDDLTLPPEKKIFIIEPGEGGTDAFIRDLRKRGEGTLSHLKKQITEALEVPPDLMRDTVENQSSLIGFPLGFSEVRPIKLHGRPIPRTADEAIREMEFLYDHGMPYIVRSVVQVVGGKKTCYGIGLKNAAKLVAGKLKAYFEDVGMVPEFEIEMEPRNGGKGLEIFLII